MYTNKFYVVSQANSKKNLDRRNLEKNEEVEHSHKPYINI